MCKSHSKMEGEGQIYILRRFLLQWFVLVCVETQYQEIVNLLIERAFLRIKLRNYSNLLSF